MAPNDGLDPAQDVISLECRVRQHEEDTLDFYRHAIPAMREEAALLSAQPPAPL